MHAQVWSGLPRPGAGIRSRQAGVDKLDRLVRRLVDLARAEMISGADIEAALEEMLFAGGSLNAKLLGMTPADLPSTAPG